MRQADAGMDVVDQVVDAVIEASRQGLQAGLRAGGMLTAPQVHVLDEQLQMPYLGYLTCRPFYRGNDVVTAMSMMGLFPAMLGASRLVVAWEHRDLSVALQLDGAHRAPTGHVALDARRDGSHVLRWHPYREQDGPSGMGGLPTVIPRWGDPQRHAEAQLPTPVAALLAAWRRHEGKWADDGLFGTVARFEQSGYRIRWVTRPTGERGQPRWMRILAPIL